MRVLYVFYAVILFGFQTNDAQTRAEKKALKEEIALKDYEKMQSMVDSKSYAFEANWAITQSGKRINLIGSPNYLKINSLHAIASMSYFGVAQNIAYGSDIGIKFDCEIKSYDVKLVDKKKKIIINGQTENNSEKFDFILTIFHNGNASLALNSNNRNSISYDGIVKQYNDKE